MLQFVFDQEEQHHKTFDLLDLLKQKISYSVHKQVQYVLPPSADNKTWQFFSSDKLLHRHDSSFNWINYMLINTREPFKTPELITLNSFGNMECWNVTNEKLKPSTITNQRIPFCPLFCEKSQCLIVANLSNKIEIQSWDYGNKGKVIKTLEDHDDRIRSLLLLNENELLSCGDDYCIRLWNLSTCKVIKRFMGHEDWVSALCKIDERTFVSGGVDGVIRFWDTFKEKSHIHIEKEAHSGWVEHLLYCANKKLLISYGGGDVIKVWEIGKTDFNISCVLKYRVSNPCRGMILKFQFLNKDETKILIVQDDHQISVLDLDKRRFLDTIKISPNLP